MYELQTGASFPPPQVAHLEPRPGNITQIDEDIASVSTAGPALTLRVGLVNPLARGDLVYLVARLRDERGYFPTTFHDYKDPHDHLAVQAVTELSLMGRIDDVVLVLPYVTMPEDSGGITEVEVTAYDEKGEVVAVDYRQIELPEEFDRTPDMLSVIAHTLLALCQVGEPLQKDHVTLVRTLLKANFQLDDVGDAALKRILKVAARTEHTTDTLAEVIDHIVLEEDLPRLVNLVYATARVDDKVPSNKQKWIDRLFEKCGVHDHRQFGPAHLADAYEELELARGATWDEVRTAWKRLVRDYHPDRVQHLAKGFRDFAHEKMIRLNTAYERLEQALKTAEPVAIVEIDED